MDIFTQKFTQSVDLGDGNQVVLKKLSHAEALAIADETKDTTVGHMGYVTVCRHIESWSGPAFAEFPKPNETAFKQLSSEFFAELTPHILELRGLTKEEGNA